MPKRIPISAARAVAEAHDCRQVILLAWDGTLTHIVTYGKTADDCAQAAAGGNMLKEKWGWPECNDQPSRVKKLEKELERAEAALREAREILEAIVHALHAEVGRKGNYWKARKLLDKFGKYHGNVQGLQVLIDLGELALKSSTPAEGREGESVNG